MKTLFLVRHAKSSWAEADLGDRERPLAERGRRDAPAMGRHLHKLGARVDLMVSSPALRALSTARLLARQLGYPRREIAVEERLYPGTPAQLLRVIHRLETRLRHVMLIGHNPGMSELAHGFAGEITHLPTCAVAELRFEADTWNELGRGTCVLVRFDYPKGI